MLGTQVPPNKAVIGANAFAHSSGIHVDGFLKQRETYEIMRPEDVGMSESRVVLTARTGRHGLLDRLKKLGYPLSEQELDQAYRRFLIVADKKQEVFDEDLMAILHDEIHSLPATFELQYLHIYSGTSAIPTATVRLRVKDSTLEGAAIGDGPVDACCQAINAVVGETGELQGFTTRSVSEGTGALAEVTVRVKDLYSGRTFVGHGTHVDVVEASGEAYLDAVNRLLGTRDAEGAASAARGDTIQFPGKSTKRVSA
jgi:2-isopropylmalate synthase